MELNLEPEVGRHLKNVYATLFISTGSAAAGSFVHMFSSIISSGILTMLGAVACLLALVGTQHDGKNQAQRLGYLAGFAFFSGINMGPLLQFATVISPTIVMEALFATALVFMSFTLAALFAPRGSYLYLGGTLFSILNTLFWLALLNLFYGSTLLYQANLYIGLAVMCGFIVYDTQHIVEKRRAGDKDYILHSFELFIDLLSIFKKLVIILSEKEGSKKKRNKN